MEVKGRRDNDGICGRNCPFPLKKKKYIVLFFTLTDG